MTPAPGGHERLYRGLLRLYPASYREKYADQMVQLFGDQRRADGSLRTWLHSSIDLVTSAASEHVRSRTVAQTLTLAPTPIARVMGALGVIGGLAILSAFVIQIEPDMNLVRLILFNIGAIAIAIGVQRIQAFAGRRLAMSATIAVVAANLLYALMVLRELLDVQVRGLGWAYTLVGAFMWASDLYFGLVALRLGVVNRFAPLALLTGSFFAFIGQGIFGLTVPGTLLNDVIMGGIAVHGLGWILFGLIVALRRRSVPPATA